MPRPIEPKSFNTRFRRLILLAWTVPAVFGLSFLLIIRMFTLEQMRIILISPIESLFVLIWIGFAAGYFQRFAVPIRMALERDDHDSGDFHPALERMQRFPLHFWSLFLLYLIMAPSSVIMAASLYADFDASPEDWFRIHLVALIVSINVGLPIFFRILALFGRAVVEATLDRPQITV